MTPVEWFLILFALLLVIGFCRAIDDARSESLATSDPTVTVEATDSPKPFLTLGDRKTTLGKLAWCVGFGAFSALFFHSLFELGTTWGDLTQRQRTTLALNASYSYYFFWFFFTRRAPTWVELALPPLIAILWITSTIV